jgi:hypothetical protein
MYDTYRDGLPSATSNYRSTWLALPIRSRLQRRKTCRRKRRRRKKKQNKNNPHFHLADELQRITGVGLTRIDGVDVFVAQTMISEVGLDMSRWKTEVHFASWLGLCLRQPHQRR